MIRRLLIANRGEIAVRVARAAREMGIVPLGVYSEADAHAYHLTFMNDARCIGPAPALDSYLNAQAILSAAKAMRADALHPGYGFLSERAAFAREVGDAGLIFVGPPPEAMDAMGSKIEAKRRAREAGVPTVPGYDGDDQSLQRLRAEAASIGFPVLIKASAGGGGRGMRVVSSLGDLDEALAAAKREALAAFNDDAVLLERYLADPRHIEFQILADAFGTTIHLGERECSIQRRHQKIVEESPSVAMTPELRAEMGAAAVRVASSAGYVNAGTVEFMLNRDGFYFLEMNARLQVEHPVTEVVYGVDLVQWQLRIASGEPLTIAQDDVRPRGWAIEMRINAEDPARGMLPSTGRIEQWHTPQAPRIRVDSGVVAGSEVSLYYDSMLAKLIVGGNDRDKAIERIQRALDDFYIGGVRTNLPLLSWIVRDEAFRKGETTTSFLTQRLDESIFAAVAPPREALLLAAARLLLDDAVPWRLGGIGRPITLEHDTGTFSTSASGTGTAGEWHLDGMAASNVETRFPRQARDDKSDVLSASGDNDHITVTFAGVTASGVVRRFPRQARDDKKKAQRDRPYEGQAVVVRFEGRDYEFRSAQPPTAQAQAAAGGGAADGQVTAPMPGRILRIAVQPGDKVAPHELLVVLEAMKMEHRIEASLAARVGAVLVREGEIVAGGAPLVELDGAQPRAAEKR